MMQTSPKPDQLESEGIAAPQANLFLNLLKTRGHGEMRRKAPETVQINLGKRCNMTCRHCHVGAHPNSEEIMSAQTLDGILSLLRRNSSVKTVDLTGGAPELHPHFRFLISELSQLKVEIIDRSNLTVLDDPKHKNLIPFLAKHGVQIIGSLPCYLAENVNQQRGSGAFSRSIRVLGQLNQYGYGMPGSSLSLSLVYNPLGAFLPPAQSILEKTYKENLLGRYGIHFHRLLTIANMPINRFASFLKENGQWKNYWELLVKQFNPQTVPHLMCRTLVNVSWDGRLFDCDFNQMQAIPLGGAKGETPATIWDIDSLEALIGQPIATGNHCLGCTAGEGSSCQGALQ